MIKRGSLVTLSGNFGKQIKRAKEGEVYEVVNASTLHDSKGVPFRVWVKTPTGIASYQGKKLIEVLPKETVAWPRSVTWADPRVEQAKEVTKVNVPQLPAPQDK